MLDCSDAQSGRVEGGSRIGSTLRQEVQPLALNLIKTAHGAPIRTLNPGREVAKP